MKKEYFYIVILSFVYLILFSLKKTEIYFPVISDYFSDIICIPLVLGWTKIIFQKYSIQNFEWGLKPVIVAVIYFSLVFEWIMPNMSEKYTADFWDVICYLIGGLFFYFSLTWFSAISKHPQAN